MYKNIAHRKMLLFYCLISKYVVKKSAFARALHLEFFQILNSCTNFSRTTEECSKNKC